MDWGPRFCSLSFETDKFACTGRIALGEKTPPLGHSDPTATAAQAFYGHIIHNFKSSIKDLKDHLKAQSGQTMVKKQTTITGLKFFIPLTKGWIICKLEPWLILKKKKKRLGCWMFHITAAPVESGVSGCVSMMVWAWEPVWRVWWSLQAQRGGQVLQSGHNHCGSGQRHWHIAQCLRLGSESRPRASICKRSGHSQRNVVFFSPPMVTNPLVRMVFYVLDSDWSPI